MLGRLSILVVVALFASVASADLLWDNGGIGDFSTRAISPPAFPDIRVVDDFFVPPEGWRIEELQFRVFEDAGWSDGDGRIEVYIRETDPDTGGPVTGEDADLVRLSTEYRVEKLNCYFRCDYEYIVEDLGIGLKEGQYWLGIRNPRGTGSGTNYWMTSEGGRDGKGTSTGYFSINRAETWMDEGPGWQHAFEIGGTVIPEPGTLALLGAMSLLVVGERRRKGYE